MKTKSMPKRATASKKPSVVKAKAKPSGAVKSAVAQMPRIERSAPVRVSVPLIERRPSVPVERPMTAEELMMERDRIYARIVGIPNVISRPSPADYVVFEVADPNAVHRKLTNLGIPPEVVQKYPKIPNGMRVFVRSSMMNEAFLRALEVAAK